MTIWQKLKDIFLTDNVIRKKKEVDKQVIKNLESAKERHDRRMREVRRLQEPHKTASRGF